MICSWPGDRRVILQGPGHFQANEADLLGQIHSMLPNAHLSILGYYDPYAPFVNDPTSPLYPIALATAQAVPTINGLLEADAKGVGASYVDLFPLFQGEELADTYIATGNVHPNNAGYDLIANAVASVPEPSSLVLVVIGAGLLPVVGASGPTARRSGRRLALRPIRSVGRQSAAGTDGSGRAGEQFGEAGTRGTAGSTPAGRRSRRWRPRTGWWSSRKGRCGGSISSRPGGTSGSRAESASNVPWPALTRRSQAPRSGSRSRAGRASGTAWGEPGLRFPHFHQGEGVPRRFQGRRRSATCRRPPRRNTGRSGGGRGTSRSPRRGCATLPAPSFSAKM